MSPHSRTSSGRFVHRRRLIVSCGCVALAFVVSSRATLVANALGHPSTFSSTALHRLTLSGEAGGVQPPTGASTTAEQAHTVTKSIVTLITGDRVTIRQTGKGEPSISVTPPRQSLTSAVSATYIQFIRDGDRYVVPISALPYLGSTLDANLFDVTYLSGAGVASGPAQSLSLSYTGSSTPELPGIAIQSTAGGVARGVELPSKAQLFGAALVANSGHRGGRGVLSGPFAGVRHIALTRPPGVRALAGFTGNPSITSNPVAGAPAYRTLSITALDAAGSTATAFVHLVNLDDPGLVDTFVVAYGAPANLSVPDGDYSAVASILTPHAHDPGVDVALVSNPTFTVTSNRSLTLDARKAIRYSVATDDRRHTPVQEDHLNVAQFATNRGGYVLRSTGLGAPAIGLFRISVPGNTPVPTDQLAVAPSRTASKGELDFDAVTDWSDVVSETDQLQPGADPTYSFDFTTRGHLPIPRYVVPHRQLSTIDSRLYAAPARCPNTVMGVAWSYQPTWMPSTGFGGSGRVKVHAGSRFDYVYLSDPSSDYLLFSADDGCTDHYARPRQLAHGSHIVIDWNKGPVVPVPAPADLPSELAQDTGAAYNVREGVCPACQEDENGFLAFQNGGDSDPSHWTLGNYGTPDATHHFRFWRDGRLALTSTLMTVDGQGPQAGITLPLELHTADYRLQWTTTVASDLTETTSTDWAWRSKTDDPTQPGTEALRCTPDPSRPCAVLPLLFLSYDLALDYDGSSCSQCPFPVRFAAELPDGSVPAGLTATVAASFDDGRTWSTPIGAAHGAGGQFGASIYQPAASATTGAASLRVQVRDAAGDSVTQTLIRAYPLAG